MGLDVGISLLSKGYRLYLFSARLCPLGVAVLDGVDPSRLQLAGLKRRLASLREAEGAYRAKAHVARSTVQGEPEDPGARAAPGDLQIETGTIGVVAGLFGVPNFQRVEPIDELRHPSATLFLPMFLPMSLIGIVPDDAGRLKTEEA